MHQLDVVDDDETQAVAVFAPFAASARAQLHRIQARRFVDQDRRFVELAERGAEPVPVAGIELAGAKPLRIDLADRAEQTCRKLRAAHFHGEQEHRQLQLEADVLGDVQRQRGVMRDDVVVGDIEGFDAGVNFPARVFNGVSGVGCRVSREYTRCG